MTEASGILQNRSTEIDLLVAESLEPEDKLTAQQKWARPYLRFAIVVFALNMLSGFLACAGVEITTIDTSAQVLDVACRFYERLGFVASHVGLKLPLD